MRILKKIIVTEGKDVSMNKSCVICKMPIKVPAIAFSGTCTVTGNCTSCGANQIFEASKEEGFYTNLYFN